MELLLPECTIRTWRPDDAESLVRHANNRKIWRNLRDGFPHPYMLTDAQNFIRFALNQQPETIFCIAVGPEAIGGIGFHLNQDVERFSAEIGYWIGENYWGQGIVTAALQAVTAYAIKTHSLLRIYAMPYAWNPASCRVLQKAGFLLEGRMRCSVFKDGQVVDQFLYAYVVDM